MKIDQQTFAMNRVEITDVARYL